MAQGIPPLEHDRFYHIYNRGINRETIFRENDNYQYFLQLYKKYIPLIADTYAWCLMGNHFHLLVRIKEEREIGYLPQKKPNPDRSERRCQVSGSSSHNANLTCQGLQDLTASKQQPSRKKPKPDKQFSHLFNAYAKSFNKKYNRSGALFLRPFRRKPVTNTKYLYALVHYIHHNPLIHKFVTNFEEYPWSSYHSILSAKPTNLQREQVIEWFDDTENFKYVHASEKDYNVIEKYIVEE